MSTIEMMIWVFGIVFLTLVLIFAYTLNVNSLEIRSKMRLVSRKQKVTIGVLGSLMSLGSAYLALMVATGISDWGNPGIIHLIGIMLFMLCFVALQVAAMLCFVSMITDSETQDGSKRS